ncbi:hypothetical protein OH76DRAFT_537582 [Lentinus brumalis]|uniref:Uncharacterized protein n=1 Tax=Lentinus brumalis TaxID=2498619 RepID=A0A371DAJ0_9APHY|nr:hypothetical protein OH76DRAFT_537582 [Polyporus brumalis]
MVVVRSIRSRRSRSVGRTALWPWHFALPTLRIPAQEQRAGTPGSDQPVEPASKFARTRPGQPHAVISVEWCLEPAARMCVCVCVRLTSTSCSSLLAQITCTPCYSPGRVGASRRIGVHSVRR